MENLYRFTNTSIKQSELPEYLIRLLKEANKEHPDPKYWRVERSHYDEKTKNYVFDTPETYNRGIFDELWHEVTFRTGRYRCLGWEFDFSKSWKSYLVNWKDDGWKLHLAPNEEFIRKHAVEESDILEIVEKNDDNNKIKILEEKLNKIVKLGKKFISELGIAYVLPDSFYEFKKELENAVGK